MLWRKTKLGKGDREVDHLFKLITDKGTLDLQEVWEQVVWLSVGKSIPGRETNKDGRLR